MLKVLLKTLWLLAAIGFSCNYIGAQELKVAFLNTKNLYDTINTPAVDDGDFTPEGRYHWNTTKYRAKINQLAEVLRELNADIVGLCEVENADVANELAMTIDSNYKVIHYDSRDRRGIDVCLFYRPEKISIHSSELISVTTDLPTRELLRVVAGVNGEQLTFYICHLPSKRGGSKAKLRRQAIINALEQIVAQELNVVVMGDMNDDPITIRGLENLSQELAAKGLGSYCYRGVWSMLDQVLMSSSLAIRCNGQRLYNGKGTIYRTTVYNEKSASDHLAVYFLLQL